MKCAHPSCARDGATTFLGRHVVGRPTTAQLSEGVSYCRGHYEQLRRGRTVEEMKPLRPRGLNPRAAAVEDCAAIAEFHGAHDLAALFRKLGK